MKRGSFEFEVSSQGDLLDCPGNVEALRRLWLDRKMISGDDLGPGDPGDFDFGAWHSACHLVAGGGVRKSPDGRFLWLEISYDPKADEYFSSVTSEGGGKVTTHRLDSLEAKGLLQGSILLGFVEGNSVGRISARGILDPEDRFNGYPRQEYDRPTDSPADGGKVWEHWCTVRDIRPSSRIGSSVLRAYTALASALGDRFVSTVTRGRRDYGHPKQLCAMIRAGLTSEVTAPWDTMPIPIQPPVERLLLESRPADSLAAATQLSWADLPRYYMFQRRISRWSPASEVKKDLQNFGSLQQARLPGR